MPDLSFYRLSGTVVASDLELPAIEIPAEPSLAGALLFRLVSVLPAEGCSPSSLTLRDDGVSIGKTSGGFTLRFPGCADFWIAPDGTAVSGAPLDACPPETVAQLFLDQVLPLALHARGRFSFHASSVVVGGTGRRDLCAFLGNSGAGKSTLASSFARAGNDLLFSDDCLSVEVGAAGIVASPSYASARLWPESAGALFAGDDDVLPLASPRTTKLRAAFPAALEPMPLRRAYLVESGEGDPVITRLSRRAALMALAGHLYRLDAGDRARLTGELDLLERVASRVPVARLAYRRAYANLPAVREAIRADLRQPG